MAAEQKKSVLAFLFVLIYAVSKYNKNMKYTTNSSQETQKIAQEIISKLTGKETRGALVLALEGDLGAGKTTFIQGLAGALKIKERVLSPTFVIMRRFKIKKGKFKNFYHLDCFRLENEDNLNELGLEDIINNSENLVAIEWAEKIKNILPADTIRIKFEHAGGDKRRITLNL